MKLVIGWLYPNLMNTYGDKGNITVLKKRCEWRGIKAEVKLLNPGFDIKELAICDLLLMGGAQDRQQKIVNNDLRRIKKVLSQKIEEGIPGLYVCGGFQFLGKYYKEADGSMVRGLAILDLYTENPGENVKRLIGNISVQPSFDESFLIVGFENHGGRTYLEKGVESLGKVIRGYGNNGEDGLEGARYKNSFGTYMHGPILPKNPRLADYLTKLALEKKYYQKIKFKKLDEDLEEKARMAIAKRLNLEI